MARSPDDKERKPPNAWGHRKFSVGEPAADCVVKSVDLIGELRSKRAEILDIAKRHGARNVRVFGSFARGDAQANSDLDLLVDAAPKHSAFFPAGLIADLEEMLGPESRSHRTRRAALVCARSRSERGGLAMKDDRLYLKQQISDIVKGYRNIASTIYVLTITRAPAHISTPALRSMSKSKSRSQKRTQEFFNGQLKELQANEI